MPIDVLMPALSPTMTEGNLAKWMKKEGDKVSAGDVIAEIETDKATMEVEAVDEGTLGKILVDEGTESVQVNKAIAVLLEEGEDANVLDSYSPANDDVPQEEAVAEQAPAAEVEEEDEDDGGEEATPAVIPDGVTEVLMPALSPTMEEGNLAKWNVKQGDTVEAGKVIAEIETDKATMEVEAVDEGVIGKILIEGGTPSVKVNMPIALLVEEGKDPKIANDYQPAKAGTPKKAKKAKATSGGPAPKAAPQAAGGMANVETVAPEPPKGAALPQTGARVAASPLAKRLAAEKGLSLNAIRGTGPKGRILKEDVEDAARYGTGGAVARNAAEFGVEAHNSMRKVIAKRLKESKQQIPHFYLTVDCELDALLDARRQLNAAAEGDENGKPAYKVSVNDMIIKATALAMKKKPEVNVSWYDDKMVQYTNIDISVAVATEGGLITPIIKNADQKPLQQISTEMKDLATRARQNALKPEEFQGGGFSISNLGMFGVNHFSAIINPPQSCILAVGAGEERVVVKNGEMQVANVMTVTLSVDHRAVDGALGAEFLQHFKRIIEAPVALFI